MLLQETNFMFYSPDKDGLIEFKVTGDQFQAIQTAIQHRFLMPSSEASEKHKKALEAHNKKYEDRDTWATAPEPPKEPVSTGIPGDFVLIIRPERKSTGAARLGRPMESVMGMQEITLYTLFGSVTAKKFVAEVCGISI